MTSIKQLDKEIERLVNRMHDCGSTQGRKYNWEQIKDIYNSDERLSDYWDYTPEAFLYVAKITRRPYTEIQRRLEKRMAKVKTTKTLVKPNVTKDKEYLYIGYYIDADNNFILKVGTTKDLEQRRRQHNNTYRKAKRYTMADDSEFIYLWSIPLSKYNTLRFEDRTKEIWKSENIGMYIRNDRFVCEVIPKTVKVTIKKTYEIPIREMI